MRIEWRPIRSFKRSVIETWWVRKCRRCCPRSRYKAQHLSLPARAGVWRRPIYRALRKPRVNEVDVSREGMWINPHVTHVDIGIRIRDLEKCT